MRKHTHRWAMTRDRQGAACSFPGCKAVLLTSGQMVAGAPRVSGVALTRQPAIERKRTADGLECVSFEPIESLEISLRDDMQDAVLAVHQLVAHIGMVLKVKLAAR